MRVQIFVAFMLATQLIAGCQREPAHPEVAFRHCMREQAIKLDRPLTYDDALRFASNCDGLATNAAKAALASGRNPDFHSDLKKAKADIVRSHVCAYSRDVDRCAYIM